MGNSGGSPAPERLSDLPPLERSLVITWVVVKTGLPFLYLVAFASAMFASTVGGFAVLCGLAAYYLVNYLAVGVISRYAGELQELWPQERVWLCASGVSLGVLFVGVCLVPIGWAGAAALLVGGLFGHLATHVGAAIGTYRRVMARPWPDVAPINEDDWE